MPTQRSYNDARTDWSLRRLNPEANILHPSSNNNIMLNNLGKITRRMIAPTFPENDGTLLVHAICSAREEVSSGSGAASATAVARASQQLQPEVHDYLGEVKSIEGEEVIAQIGPSDDMDRWDVIIPLASFEEQPQANQEITCRITRFGSHADITVQILSNKPLPELKDFGIDKEELLSWASQLDV